MSCGAELSAVNSACADYYTCLCPDGANALSCTPSASCSSALIAISDECTSCDACSGGPATDGGGYTITTCPAAGVARACVSCLQASCATELAAIDSACEGF